MRTFFGEIAAGPRGPALSLHAFGDDHNTLVIGIIACTLYVNVPRWPNRDYDIEMGYGFSFTDIGLHLHWGKRTKVLWYPWSWEFYKRWELVSGGSYAAGREFWIEVPRRMNHGELATKHQYVYTYNRKNGDVQKVVATYYVGSMEHRWRWLQWLPFPRRVSKFISVDFSNEVGEGTGSYKGGVLGCGYDMLPGESALECLQRMERERKFSR